MTADEKILELFEIVQQSFSNALKHPDVARWGSCAQLAGVASVRVGVDGDTFRAAALEGVSMEASRRMRELLALRPEGIAA